MTETPTDADAESFGSRIRERIGSISPFSLVMLGFIGFLGDAVPQLEILTLFHLFWLFALWPFVSMLTEAIKQSVGYDGDGTDPRAWLEMDEGWRGQFAFLLGVPLSLLNPLLFRQDAMQLLGSLVAVIRHRGSLPTPETHTHSSRYRLPVDGTWTVVNGSPIQKYSHSWFPATQRYAYDFVVTDDEGRSRPADTDTSIENYYCYDRPVLAPADGTVVDTHDGDPELRWAGGFSHPLKRSVTGNYVTIRHADSEYSCLVHLVPGSIEVEPGDRVERGAQIGRCGHSGNSAEPHLHFQLQDHPTFEVAAGLPVRFQDVDVDTPGTNVATGTQWDEPDGTGRYIHVGQRVSHSEDVEPRRTDGTPADPEVISTVELSGITTLGRVANGLSVGGYATILAGFFVSSLLPIAFGLAGVAGLTLAYQAGRWLLTGDQMCAGPVSTAVGVGVAAALVGVSSRLMVSPSSASTIGAAVFLTGFLVYLFVWEYGRGSLFRNTAPANGAAD